MINLTKGNTEYIYFTGTEKALLVNPFFLFVFTNRITLDVVKVMVTNTSAFARYDKGVINVDTYFTGKDEGLWSYAVYEKASNVDLTVAGNIVEIGYMNLIAETVFTPVEYSEQNNNFVTYDGQ
jgi:hypothetical protein